MVQQQEHRHGADEAENARQHENGLAPDAVGQQSGRDYDRQQHRHAQRVDLERARGRNAAYVRTGRTWVKKDGQRTPVDKQQRVLPCPCGELGGTDVTSQNRGDFSAENCAN
jgi:hypothetical protein